ncbi:hypothetical protein ACFFMN_28845 [Planobispora siamensis]|uniref:Uncharacterized protein n=1 Tax=Planobispora siamensis TaxID=936338 RepID=A0A8J3SQ40_9ACTN|nr:hypothetical protein [Planobispora siamensis]GIH97425.1 hypothetical protein Psi01_80550 [Planobispora siamensis]
MPALTRTGFFQSRFDTLPDDLSPLATLRRVWIAEDVAVSERELLRLQQWLPPGRLRRGRPR